MVRGSTWPISFCNALTLGYCHGEALSVADPMVLESSPVWPGALPSARRVYELKPVAAPIERRIKSPLDA